MDSFPCKFTLCNEDIENVVDDIAAVDGVVVVSGCGEFLILQLLIVDFVTTSAALFDALSSEQQLVASVIIDSTRPGGVEGDEFCELQVIVEYVVIFVYLLVSELLFLLEGDVCSHILLLLLLL